MWGFIEILCFTSKFTYEGGPGHLIKNYDLMPWFFTQEKNELAKHTQSGLK